MQYVIKQLHAHLFWDSDVSKLDDVEHYEQIILRAYDLGDLEDMITVNVIYGKENCKEVLMRTSYLTEQTITLASFFLNVDREKFMAI